MKTFALMTAVVMLPFVLGAATMPPSCHMKGMSVATTAVPAPASKQVAEKIVPFSASAELFERVGLPKFLVSAAPADPPLPACCNKHEKGNKMGLGGCGCPPEVALASDGCGWTHSNIWSQNLKKEGVKAIEVRLARADYK